MAIKKAMRRNTGGGNAGREIIQIAMVCGFDRNDDSGVMRGIGRYALQRDNWALVSFFPHRRLAEDITAIRPAGIIVKDICPGIDDILRKAAIPVVNVSIALADPRFHQVTRDEASIGSAAANHLVECGLQNFGYFGPPWDGPSSNREGGFCQALRRLSHTVSTCYVRPPGDNPRSGTFASKKQVCRWLAQLPKPVGVFTPHDMWAVWLSGVCKQQRINVPEEVAIIGTGNDELLCELASPSLSSVMIPAEQIGYEAAAILDRLMNGKPVSDKPLLLPAIGVSTRQSTNVLAGVEPVILAAIHFIREHICEPITVDDVAGHTHLSRRSFDRKFRAALGRGPAQEICRMRLGMAKTLLTSNPGMKTESIARHCGFAYMTHFFRAFQQTTGMTPADYRRTMGLESGRKVSSAKVLADFSADSCAK
jgi:LacI family transcriptional regulator